MSRNQQQAPLLRSRPKKPTSYPKVDLESIKHEKSSENSNSNPNGSVEGSDGYEQVWPDKPHETTVVTEETPGSETAQGTTGESGETFSGSGRPVATRQGTITGENSPGSRRDPAPQRRASTRRNPRHVSRRANWNARLQFQQQQRLSLSTRIDDNSTLYELIDDLLKVVSQNSDMKEKLWSQVDRLSGRLDEQHQEQVRMQSNRSSTSSLRSAISDGSTDNSDVEQEEQFSVGSDEQFMNDLKQMPSAFKYGEKYKQLRKQGMFKVGTATKLRRRVSPLFGGLKNLVGNKSDRENPAIARTEREIMALTTLLAQRTQYNRELLSTIESYEDNLTEIMSQMASKHVQFNKDELNTISKYESALLQLQTKMYNSYQSYTAVEDKSVKLYDYVDKIADYIAALDLNKK